MEIHGATVGDTLYRFQGILTQGYRGSGHGDTGDTTGNTCYKLHGGMDMVIHVIQLKIHLTSYRGYV